MLHNSTNRERVVENFNRVTHLGPLAGLGLQIVNNQFVRLFEWSATHKYERAQGIVALKINPVDIFWEYPL